MSIEVHVEGVLSYGGLADFPAAAARYREYAASHGYVVPQILLGLSGPMNTVRLVFRYDNADQYVENEAGTMDDREHGKLAGAMGFAEGTVRFTIYRPV